MLRIKDKDGKVKFVLRDEDEEPLSIDELILNDNVKPNEREKPDAKHER